MDAEAEDRDDAKFAGSEWFYEVWDEAAEHHHRVSDGEADGHGAGAGRGANARERLVLALGVKARKAAVTSIAVAIEQARNNRDIARFDVAMECEVVTWASVVSIGAAFASWAHGGVADFGEEMRCLRVTIKSSLLTAAARADETACGVSASHLLVIGRSNGAGDGTVEAKAGFQQKTCARIGTGKVIKYSAASIFHQRGIADVTGQRPRIRGDGACAMHGESHKVRRGARPEVGWWRERNCGDLRPERRRDFLRR